MSKFKFKTFNRYDEMRAQKGIEHTAMDELDQVRGTFRVSLQDMTSKFVKVELERVARENEEQLKKLTNEEREKFVFANLFIHDWKDVLDGDDQPVPFSQEAAYELFLHDEWLFVHLNNVSRNIHAFQADPRATKEKTAKN